MKNKTNDTMSPPDYVIVDADATSLDIDIVSSGDDLNHTKCITFCSNADAAGAKDCKKHYQRNGGAGCSPSELKYSEEMGWVYSEEDNWALISTRKLRVGFAKIGEKQLTMTYLFVKKKASEYCGDEINQSDGCKKK